MTWAASRRPGKPSETCGESPSIRCAGPPVRRQGASSLSRLRAGCHRDARPWHWRDDGGVLRRRCGGASPSAVPHPGRLFAIHSRSTSNGRVSTGVSIRDFLAWRDHQAEFGQVSLVGGGSYKLVEGEPEELRGCEVTGDLFATLGAKPLLGRAFGREHEIKGNHWVAIISYGFWQRRFGGDPHIVGRRLRLDAGVYEVLGVMPDGFTYPAIGRPFDLWTPLAFDASARDDVSPVRGAVLRLKDGSLPTGHRKAPVHFERPEADPRVRLAAVSAALAESCSEHQALDGVAPCCCRVRAAHRVRERGPPDPVSDVQPLPRAGRAASARRRPGSTGSPVGDREPVCSQLRLRWSVSRSPGGVCRSSTCRRREACRASPRLPLMGAC